MKTYKMMDEVVYHCTRCKMELNHRIIRVESGRPKRVLCLTCQTERSYRASAPAKAKAGRVSKAGAVAKVGAAKTPGKRAPAGKKSQEAEWLARLSQRRAEPKAYDMAQAYQLDDAIQHQTFGVGLVVDLIPPDKIQVFFPDGAKTLKCGRT
jgi:hypothetical protein